jgi:hypothetical protein
MKKARRKEKDRKILMIHGRQERSLGKNLQKPRTHGEVLTQKTGFTRYSDV